MQYYYNNNFLLPNASNPSSLLKYSPVPTKQSEKEPCNDKDPYVNNSYNNDNCEDPPENNNDSILPPLSLKKSKKKTKEIKEKPMKRIIKSNPLKPSTRTKKKKDISISNENPLKLLKDSNSSTNSLNHLQPSPLLHQNLSKELLSQNHHSGPPSQISNSFYNNLPSNPLSQNNFKPPSLMMNAYSQDSELYRRVYCNQGIPNQGPSYIPSTGQIPSSYNPSNQAGGVSYTQPPQGPYTQQPQVPYKQPTPIPYNQPIPKGPPTMNQTPSPYNQTPQIQTGPYEPSQVPGYNQPQPYTQGIMPFNQSNPSPGPFNQINTPTGPFPQSTTPQPPFLNNNNNNNNVSQNTAAANLFHNKLKERMLQHHQAQMQGKSGTFPDLPNFPYMSASDAASNEESNTSQNINNSLNNSVSNYMKSMKMMGNNANFGMMMKRMMNSGAMIKMEAPSNYNEMNNNNNNNKNQTPFVMLNNNHTSETNKTLITNDADNARTEHYLNNKMIMSMSGASNNVNPNLALPNNSRPPMPTNYNNQMLFDANMLKYENTSNSTNNNNNALNMSTPKPPSNIKGYPFPMPTNLPLNIMNQISALSENSQNKNLKKSHGYHVSGKKQELLDNKNFNENMNVNINNNVYNNSSNPNMIHIKQENKPPMAKPYMGLPPPNFPPSMNNYPTTNPQASDFKQAIIYNSNGKPIYMNYPMQNQHNSSPPIPSPLLENNGNSNNNSNNAYLQKQKQFMKMGALGFPPQYQNNNNMPPQTQTQQPGNINLSSQHQQQQQPNQTKHINFYQINLSNPSNQQQMPSNYSNSNNMEMIQKRMQMMNPQQTRGSTPELAPNIPSNSLPQDKIINNNINYPQSFPFDNEHILKMCRDFAERRTREKKANGLFFLPNSTKKSKGTHKEKHRSSTHTKTSPVSNTNLNITIPNPNLISNNLTNLNITSEREKSIEKNLLNVTQNPLIYNSNEQKIGALTIEERRMKIEKYKKKKIKRSFNRKINYFCRKQVADKRLRLKGRFMKKPNFDSYNSES